MAGHRRVRVSVVVLRRVGGALHRVPPSHVVHVAHHRGGPCHFVTIFGIRVARVRRMARSSGVQGRRHSPLGLQRAGQASKGTTASLWAPVPLSPPLQGEMRQVMLPRLAREHAWRRPAVPCAANARIFLEPTAFLVAPHPEVRRPNPLTRVSEPSHQSVSSPVTADLRRRHRPVGGVPETCSDRREQGKWQRDNTLLTGLGRMIGACNISNRSSPLRNSPNTSTSRSPRSTRGDTAGKVHRDSESGNTSATGASTSTSGLTANSRTRVTVAIPCQCPRLRSTTEGPHTEAGLADGARSNSPPSE